MSELSDLEIAEFVGFDNWNTAMEAEASCLCIHDDASSTGQCLHSVADTSSKKESSFHERQIATRKRALKQHIFTQLCLHQDKYKLSRPRVVRKDFRRDFPMMWVHATNTGCRDYLMEHLMTFYSPDVVLRERDLRSLSVAPAFRQSESRGLASFSEFWYTSMHMLPDLVCTLKHSVLRVRSNGTCTVQSSFVLSGTKVVQLSCGEELTRLQQDAEGLMVDNMDETSVEGVSIDATVAAVAAVTPLKVREAILMQKIERRKAEQQKGCAKPNASVDISATPQQGLASTAEPQVHIPYSVLRKMTTEDNSFKSLRFDNNAQVNLGMNFTTCSIIKDENGADKSVLLTGEVNIFCSVETTFNAECKVESIIFNYIT